MVDFGAFLDDAKHEHEPTTHDNIKSSNLVNKSYPQMLIEIAKQNNGILNVSFMTELLVKANMGTVEQVRHNIGNALWRNREHFSQISKGQ